MEQLSGRPSDFKQAEKGGPQAARKRAPQENTKGIDKRQENGEGEREKEKKRRKNWILRYTACERM